ncbi:hypothetical protein V8E53_001389 [Lactarius tabidus]
MPISIPAFSFYLLLIGSARAGVSAPNCTDNVFAWTFNSLQQNPCLVAAYLAAVCNSGSFIIPSLIPGNSYNGPSGADNGDQCKCNTVLYNLLSACDACQGQSWIPYTVWTSNCTTKVSPGTFPSPVPAGTRVPYWAYIDISIGDSWNFSVAQLVGDSPEVTGTATIIPTSTSKAPQSVTSSISSSSTSHHSSNVGAIAGGVVGGILGAALIAGVVLWLAFRRRHARPVFQGGEKEQPLPQPLAKGAPKLYDPSDPTTYPSKDYLPLNNQRLGSTKRTQSSDGGYSGLPEI